MMKTERGVFVILKNWQMSYGQYRNLPCILPCSMYSVLLQHGLIKDPFYGLNELELTDLSKKGCTFKTEFTADEDMIKEEYVELTFYGLDTICSIFVNGVLIDSVKNMHRTYTYDIKDKIKAGKNSVELVFSSPIEYFEKMNELHHVYTSSDCIQGAAHLRKALYMSGWDWGPKLPDMGIFRDVCIDAYSSDKIEDVFISQRHKDNEVILDIEAKTKHNKDNEIFVSVDGMEIKLKNNKGSITIQNPRLWWVRGYGDQPLYEICTSIKKDNEIIDCKSMKIGLRTLSVSTEADKWGNEFCFVINGVKIFAMGANYVPQDNLLPRISPDRTEKLIQTAIDANFNCLRIWGGGYYPEDEFYDICDREGIIVWQDFMVACATIWLNKDMEEEFTHEAIQNVKRLRHHPSLGLLCGNNEMELAILEWKSVEKTEEVKSDYLRLYEKLLPEICEKYAPDTFYWSASPSSGGGFDNPNDETRGDVHYWKVWHGNLPFTAYREHKFRFCSEYGFESYPSIKTIRSFCEKEDMNCFSRVMENHQKCKTGNSKILMYLSQEYLYPNNFETLVYASQLMQADAVKYAVEHFRRNRGCCMGSTYWQFNDCWPVASWSSIDCNLRYKALHYAAKKFYAPIAMGLFLEDGKLTVNISNETMNDFKGEILVVKTDAKFSKQECCKEKISVESLSSSDVFTIQADFEDKYSEFFYADLFDEDGNFVVRQTVLATTPKHFNWQKPQIDVEIKPCKDGAKILVSSNTFAKGVAIDFDDIDCVMSDNFFDLTDRNHYCIKVKTDYSVQKLKESLKVTSVYDIGR